jgi:hypothetical protein
MKAGSGIPDGSTTTPPASRRRPKARFAEGGVSYDAFICLWDEKDCLIIHEDDQPRWLAMSSYDEHGLGYHKDAAVPNAESPPYRARRQGDT